MKRLMFGISLLLLGCGGPSTPFSWPTDPAGLAALAICGDGNVVCDEGKMCSDGNDCFPICDGAMPIGSCSNVGNCEQGYICVHQLCVAWGGSPKCSPDPIRLDAATAVRPIK